MPFIYLVGMLPVLVLLPMKPSYELSYTARCTHVARFSRNKPLGAKQSSHVLAWITALKNACRDACGGLHVVYTR
jgi:hypothetical protein